MHAGTQYSPCEASKNLLGLVLCVTDASLLSTPGQKQMPSVQMAVAGNIPVSLDSLAM